MKFYLSPLLCVLSTVACATNQPADAPVEPARNEATTPVVASGDLRSPSDGTLEPTRADAQPGSAHDTPATTHSHDANNAPVVSPSNDTRPATMDEKARVASVPADNTKLNQRDMKGSALTPMDQGEGQADLDITKKIRQAVVGDGSLSFTAKNVKIITRDGKVTLRGPVNSAEERATILSAAQKVAGATNVDNQLEVKK